MYNNTLTITITNKNSLQTPENKAQSNHVSGPIREKKSFKTHKMITPIFFFFFLHYYSF